MSIVEAARKKLAEEWRSLPGFRHYEVSDRGRVRSLRGRWDDGRILKVQVNKSGYERVQLYNPNSKRKWMFVHQAVLLAFGFPRPSLQHGVSHLNDIKNDNRLINLEWATATENQAMALKNGRLKQRAQHPSAKLTEQDIVAIRKRYKKLCRKNGTLAMARDYGVDRTTITRIVTGRMWKDRAKAVADEPQVRHGQDV